MTVLRELHPTLSRDGAHAAGRATDVDEAIIEAQLAHAVKDSLGRAYNRTRFLEQRRKVLQTWADYKLREGAEVIPIRRRSMGRSARSRSGV